MAATRLVVPTCCRSGERGISRRPSRPGCLAPVSSGAPSRGPAERRGTKSPPATVNPHTFGPPQRSRDRASPSSSVASSTPNLLTKWAPATSATTNDASRRRSPLGVQTQYRTPRQLWLDRLYAVIGSFADSPANGHRRDRRGPARRRQIRSLDRVRRGIGLFRALERVHVGDHCVVSSRIGLPDFLEDDAVVVASGGRLPYEPDPYTTLRDSNFRTAGAMRAMERDA
jgi:hypothetical protein